MFCRRDGPAESLSIGDPLVAPAGIGLAQVCVELLRKLHKNETWRQFVNRNLVDALKAIDGGGGGGGGDVDHLRQNVWPALAFIGGVDGGLRVGGRCVHKTKDRLATVLGGGTDTVRIQYDNDGDYDEDDDSDDGQSSA